jgi:hypothetical protein
MFSNSQKVPRRSTITSRRCKDPQTEETEESVLAGFRRDGSDLVYSRTYPTPLKRVGLHAATTLAQMKKAFLVTAFYSP